MVELKDIFPHDVVEVINYGVDQPLGKCSICETNLYSCSKYYIGKTKNNEAILICKTCDDFINGEEDDED